MSKSKVVRGPKGEKSPGDVLISIRYSPVELAIADALWEGTKGAPFYVGLMRFGFEERKPKSGYHLVFYGHSALDRAIRALEDRSVAVPSASVWTILDGLAELGVCHIDRERIENLVLGERTTLTCIRERPLDRPEILWSYANDGDLIRSLEEVTVFLIDEHYQVFPVPRIK